MFVYITTKHRMATPLGNIAISGKYTTQHTKKLQSTFILHYTIKEMMNAKRK